MNFEDIPAAMQNLRQWVCWGAPDRPKKMPFNPSAGTPAKAGQPNTWAPFHTACQGVSQGYYKGIGFQFATDGGLVGIDFDHCIDNGRISPEVSAWVERFNSYTEVSPSGTGLHIFCKGKLPGKAVKTQGVEMYDRQRYFTVTGNTYGPVKSLREAQEAIKALYEELTQQRMTPQQIPTEKEGQLLEDKQVLDIAGRARNAELFKSLYSGQWRSYYSSQSEADLALCNILAFYCGKDAAQIDRLFRQSGLMRPKWDRQQSGTTYGALTIQNAVGSCGKVYNPRVTAEQVFSKVLPEKKQGHILDIISAKELQNKRLPPPRYVVVDMLPQGLSLLASPPKYGKSWFVLDLCLSVAAGTQFMKHQTVKSGCLYLALEDSERRLQDRMNKILSGKEAPDGFDYATFALDIGQGLIEQLEDYLKKKPGTGLVVIDTLQKVRSASNGKENAYSADYREIGVLKNFADRHGICLVLVHHLRKMGDDGDPFNRISGTNGLLGAADTALVMTKDKRSDSRTTLSMTGRDIENRETVIEFRKEDYKWHVLGELGQLQEQQARLEYESNPIVLTIKSLLDQSPKKNWSGTMQELLDAGKHLVGAYLAENPRLLSSRVRALDRPLFKYDRIIHDRAKNGNAGGRHHFYLGIVDSALKETPPTSKTP